MADEFGIIGTSIQQLEEINDELFSSPAPAKKAAPPAAPKPAAQKAGKKDEKKEEEEEEEGSEFLDPEAITDELFGQEGGDEPAEEEEETPAPDKSSAKPAQKKDPTPAPVEEEEEVEGEFNQFEALSKNLYELGIFSADEDEEGNPSYTLSKSPEEFKSLWEEQKAKALDTSLYNYLMNKHGEEGINVFKAIFQDGVNPKEYFQSYVELQDLSTLDVENETHQEQIVREHLRKSKWAEDKINLRISRLKDRAELQEEAEMILPQLIEERQQSILDKQEAARNAEQARIAQETQFKTQVNRLLTEAIKTKELDGVSITQEKAQKISAYMNEKRYENKTTGEKYTQFEMDLRRLKDPDNLKMSVKLAALLMDKLDLTSVQKKALSKESNSLFKEFTQKKTRRSTVSASQAQWDI